MPRVIHNSDEEQTKKGSSDRFDGSNMFWEHHRKPVLPPLPPNFHGPAPLPREDTGEPE